MHDQLIAWYCINKSYSHQLLTADGAWSSVRGFHNQHRGDKGSIQQRKVSVESVGIMLNVRKGPWIKDKDPSDPQSKLQIEHWATLLDGAQAAWLEDVQKKNAVLQKSINTPIDGALLFHHRMPSDASKFNVYMGNLLNAIVTIFTIIEVIESAGETVEPSWARKKKANSWTLQSQSQTALENLKWELIQVLFPRRWKDYRSYEITAIIHSKTKEITIEVGVLAGQNLWVSIKSRIKNNIDLQNKMCEDHHEIIKIRYEIGRRFRIDFPHHIPDLIEVFLPRLASSKFGQCSMAELPNPANPHFKADQLDDLLLRMTGSAMVRNAASQLSDLKQGEVNMIQKIWSKNRQFIAKKTAADAKASSSGQGGAKKTINKEKPQDQTKGKKKSTAKASSVTPKDANAIVKDRFELKADQIETFDLDEQVQFLTHLDMSMVYMLKISSEVARPLQEPFTQIALALSTGASFPIKVGGTSKVIKGLQNLFKVFRVEVYRQAALQPRPSDVDFGRGSFEDALQATVAAIQVESESSGGSVAGPGGAPSLLPLSLPPLSTETLVDSIAALGSQAKAKLYDVLVCQDVTGPFQSQLQAAHGMSQVIGTLRTKIDQQGGELDTQDYACTLLMKTVAAEVVQIMPPEIETLLGLVMRAQDEKIVDLKKIFDHRLIPIFESRSFDSKAASLYRYQLFAYLTSVVGRQTFPMTKGGQKELVTYLTPVGHQIMEEAFQKDEDLIAVLKGWQPELDTFESAVVKFTECFIAVMQKAGVTTYSLFIYSFANARPMPIES